MDAFGDRAAFDRRGDGGGGPDHGRRVDQELLTQEFRLNYDAGALRWVAGAYAAREEQSAFREQQFTSFTQSENAAEITNFALFGEVSYEFVPNWPIIAGGRIDRIRQEQEAFLANNGVTTADTSTEFEDTVLIPKLGLR